MKFEVLGIPLSTGGIIFAVGLFIIWLRGKFRDFTDSQDKDDKEEK